MGKTAIIYCRVSTAAQREADTIEAQLETCKRIVERNELTLLKYGPNQDGWVIDNGVSGSLLAGRAFSVLLDDLEAQRIYPDYLVVYSLSRIARIDRTSKKLDKLAASHAAAARIQSTLIGCNVETWDQEGPLRADSLLWGVKILLASQEYKDIKERTIDGKARRFRANCFSKGGKPPYGYQQVGDHKTGFKLEPDPVDSKNLLLLFRWYLEGGFTSAAHKATEAEIPNPMSTNANRRGRAKDWTPTRWSPVSVMHIVKNINAYRGSTIYEFDGKPYKLTYPALIDAELCARIINRKDERTVKHREEFLSTGFVDCACGEHVHQKNTHGRHFTRCPAGCGSMPQRKFESYLWTSIVCRLIQIRRHEGGRTSERDYTAEIQKCKLEIEAVNKSITSLLDLYMDGLDKETWRIKNEALNQKKALHQASLDRIQRQIESQKHKRVTEQTLEQQLRSIIDELYSNEPAPTRKREVLARLLNGGRVGVQFDTPVPVRRKDGEPHKGAHTSPGLTLTLPAFGGLPQVSIDTKKEIQPQLLGRGSVAGKSMISSHIGQPLEEVELQLLAKLRSVGGRVLSRTKMPDGSVEIIKQADAYPW